ncbi:uncharacterized protein LOC135828845 [Sycon ciliatum]|uniref:uncharacterized protein LOC135828845 n=1 Tax=Sycon ciliatum TaxID=27933 RepID=UPI0031F6F728
MEGLQPPNITLPEGPTFRRHGFESHRCRKMLLIHHGWSLLLSLAIVLPCYCVALPVKDVNGSTTRDVQETVATALDESSVEHKRAERSIGRGPLVRQSPHAEHRQKGKLAFLPPMIHDNVIDEVLQTPVDSSGDGPDVLDTHAVSWFENADSFGGFLDIPPVTEIDIPQPSEPEQPTAAAAAATTEVATTEAATKTAASTTAATAKAATVAATTTTPPAMDMTTPPAMEIKAPMHHQMGQAASCRRELASVSVEGDGCRKAVSIGVCKGTCMHTPRTKRRHPYVLYSCQSCEPTTTKIIEVAMNDRYCQSQRGRLVTERGDRNKTFNSIYVPSALSCSCRPYSL